MLLAQFDTRGDHYRPEQGNPAPTFAMIDARRTTLTPSGSALLVSHMLQASGVICEHNPNCPPPTPAEGVWAVLHDIERGSAIWTIQGRAETFGGVGSAPVIRDDGRYALLPLPPTAEGASLALIDMRSGAVLQRLPGVESFGFIRGGRTIWLEYGGLLAFYSLGDQRARRPGPG